MEEAQLSSRLATPVQNLQTNLGARSPLNSRVLVQVLTLNPRPSRSALAQRKGQADPSPPDSPGKVLALVPSRRLSRASRARQMSQNPSRKPSPRTGRLGPTQVTSRVMEPDLSPPAK